MTTRITVNFDDDEAEWIEEMVAQGEFASKSECVREVFEDGRAAADLQARIDELEERLDRRDERIDDLETQLSTRQDRVEELEAELVKRGNIEEKIEDLPAKIQDRETYQERRRRLLDQASLTQRFKWKLTGVPVDDVEDETD